ncbi:MAG: metal-dependent hydrolase [Bacteroidales bacterium]|nr:metal-dependent hydrolase [Bacteroidales bacterium]
MNRFTTKCLFALSALVLAACGKETVSDTLAVREMTFTAERESSAPGSKTAIQPDGKSVWWLVGDKISVFAGPGSAGSEFVSQESEPGPVAVFKGEAAQADTYYGIYPANEAAAVSSDGIFTVYLPGRQRAVKGTFDTDLAPTVAIAEGHTMTFRNVAGGIKFSLAEEGVSSVIIRGCGGELLAGKATVSMQSGVPELQSVVDGQDEIVLTAPDGGFVAGKNYYALMFPVSLPEGLSITLTHSGGVPDSKLVSSRSRTIKRATFGVLDGLNSLTPSEGKVRFYVTAESSIAQVLNLPEADLGTFTVNVNGSDCNILTDTDGRYYIEVPESADWKYDAVLYGPGAGKWFGPDAFDDIMVPYSQFWNTTKEAYLSYPRSLTWSPGMGNVLSFSDCLSMVNVKLNGDASISSVKVRAAGGEDLSGCTPAGGLDWAVVNCTDRGGFVKLNSNEVSIPVFIRPGTYAGGLEITVCDASHKMMRRTLAAVSVKPGEVVNAPLTWSPDSDLLFYEGFDCFVWGGDIMSGENSAAYAPDDAAINSSAGLDRTGYEDAAVSVAYSNPGIGFIQTSATDNTIVGDTHAVSDSYVASRNIADWTYMCRCQERPGYLSVGTGNKYRGILRTPFMRSIDSVTDMVLTFKFCLQPGFNDSGLLVQLLNAGYITGCKIDGADVDHLSKVYKSNYCEAKYSRSIVSIPASDAEAKDWHTAELSIANATDATLLDLRTASSSYGVHGFWIDDIMLRSVPGSSRKGNLRLMYWNIQNGMWYDQPNNYNNFVEFVKKYDPDVCVWCEAASIYKNNTSTGAPSSDRYLPSNWPALAKRYGHNYAALGGWRDNYPQEITSKYPISTLLKITNTSTSGKPVAHGAAIQQVVVNGHNLRFVTCHMWPQSYGFGVSSADQAASSAAHEGDYYRQFEMQYIVDKTINNSSYASEEWVLLGDMNSRSRQDNGTYGYAATNTAFLTQDVILNNTDMKDVIIELYPAPDNFMASTFGTSRIDYVYVSPVLMDKVVNAFILADQWNYRGDKSPYVDTFRMPSDHRPIIVDFDLL